VLGNNWFSLYLLKERKPIFFSKVSNNRFSLYLLKERKPIEMINQIKINEILEKNIGFLSFRRYKLKRLFKTA
jgi:hypothetical protein